jgi:anti-sigma factor RsiW
MLRGRAASEVAGHVATCEACAREVELLKALRGALEMEPSLDVERVAAVVTRRTLGAAGMPKRRRWAPIVGGLAVAASALFAVLLLSGGEEGDATLTPVAAHVGAQETSAPAGGARSDSGAGGSLVPPPAVRLADAGLGVGGALSDLDDAELEQLLRRLDAMEAIPVVSPSPAVVTDFEVQ